MTKEYEVIVAGTVLFTCKEKDEAEKKLSEIKNSFLAMVHPVDTFYIREKI